MRFGLLIALLAALAAAPRSTPLRFEVSFPESARWEPADGRVFVIISRGDRPEPRLEIRSETRTSPFFAANVEGLRPGQETVVDESADGYPLERLSDLPPGDYYVQGLLNLYTTLHRADGHTVKLHMDQGEGQHFEVSPGNLYSEPRRVHIDPASGRAVRISLDRVVPPIAPPADTAYVKHVRIESALLSKFWGRPMHLGATVLLPRDYDRYPERRYPVHYEQGHFSRAGPGHFRERAKGALGGAVPMDEGGPGDFTRAWLSDGYPRMLYVTFQHPTPYYDDSYGVDSPNTGPYGRALTEELIPYIETHFRALGRPWARVLSGASTGGWEALAMQVFHPDYFGGAHAYCPDPVDFHAMQMVNIYEWDNAWTRREEGRETPIPGERDANGIVISTMKQQLTHERALGDRGRSGEQWDAWQAAFGPAGADGYLRPLFHPRTGAIDREVAAYYRGHMDLTHYLRTHWREVGPKLAGKIHIWIGDMDSYFLERAVRRLEEFLETTTDPPWGGTIVYGSRRAHCWSGPRPLADRVRDMARAIASRAPLDADTSWIR